MMESILKLMFFLVLWFVVGIYLIPGLLKRCRRLMSDETLLIVSLGLCFAMVVIASETGFSPAFGAFIMGSILAETAEAESIERLVAPVKDLFGAVFFVSVGMMVDPAMIVEYAVPILVITLAVIGGQAVFGTLGVLLSGQPLKTAMQCGFSLTQIGEFAFSDCTGLTSVTFQESLTSIESSAFDDCAGLTTVDASRCKLEFLPDENNYYLQFVDCSNLELFSIGSTRPPKISNKVGGGYGSAFTRALVDNATLKVPAESVDAYKASDWADYFDNIVPLD